MMVSHFLIKDLINYLTNLNLFYKGFIISWFKFRPFIRIKFDKSQKHNERKVNENIIGRRDARCFKQIF